MVFLLLRRWSSTMSRLRNVGIIAHIDAGKTTTTERMLYFTGRTKHLGEVDRGDTVTDYLEQERERGISIVSAAVSMPWRGHTITLVDTPGHVDFTLEVERCVAVLDGAVTILDACKGVQAQTLTVWRQALRYGVPRLVYVNKMDRPGANLALCLDSLRTRFPTSIPLPVHSPIFTDKGQFRGVLDLVNMTSKVWNLDDARDGSKLSVTALSTTDPSFPKYAQDRARLLEALAEVDDVFAEEYVTLESPALHLPPESVNAALRRVTLTGRGVAVLCGASRHNVGVQSLLDAIIDWLPSPSERLLQICPATEGHDLEHGLCALAFKTMHDRQRGPLTFLRIYAGHLAVGETIQNATRTGTEKVSRLIQPTGDHYHDLKRIGPGTIVAASGLKGTYTGDVLTVISGTGVPGLLEWAGRVGGSLEVPDPVVFAAVEAPSRMQMKALEHALACLEKEDPSFKVRVDEETGQTVIGGMGDLHLEVIIARIKNEYGVEAHMGRLLIGYRESPVCGTEEPVHHVLDTLMDGRKITIGVEVGVQLKNDDNSKSQVTFANHPEFHWNTLDRKLVRAVVEGAERSLGAGPLLRSPVLGATVVLHQMDLPHGSHTRPTGQLLPLVKAAVTGAVREALKRCGTVLLEPMMRVEVTLAHSTNDAEDQVSKVLGDLARRHAIIQSVTVSGQSGNSEEWGKTVIAQAPLEQLLGYTTTLRSLTSGRASLHLTLDRYHRMQPSKQDRVIRELKYL